MKWQFLIFSFVVANNFILAYSDLQAKAHDEVLVKTKTSSTPEYSPNVKRNFDSFSNGFGQAKRGFDEINRSYFGLVKRPFDEINRSYFGFNKRPFDEISHSAFGFQKKPFDEIGRSYFGITKKDLEITGEKAISDEVAEQLREMKRNGFDEIGRSSFGFFRRSPYTPSSSRWQFVGFGKRSSKENTI